MIFMLRRWARLRAHGPIVNFFALHELLEELLDRRVDLVTDKALTEAKTRLILPTVRYASLHG